MIALLALLLVQEVFVGGENLVDTAKPREAIGLFQRVCLTPFADPKGFQAAIGKDPERLERVDDGLVDPAPGTRKAQRVDIWHSDRFNVLYIFPDNLPVNLPVPQCQVTTRLTAPPDREQLAGMVAASLKPAGALVPVEGKPGRWDIIGEGRKWRIFLTTHTGEDGNFMALKLINIRD